MSDIRDYVTRMPFVTKNEHITWCNAWVPGGKCHSPGIWHYKAGVTKRPHAKSGNYCFTHLVTRGLRATKWDEARSERAYKKLLLEDETNALQEP